MLEILLSKLQWPVSYAKIYVGKFTGPDLPILARLVRYPVLYQVSGKTMARTVLEKCHYQEKFHLT